MSGARWAGPPADALRHVALDTLVAVFDRRSGQTHLLAEPLPQLLDALTDACLDEAALLAALAQQFDLVTDAGEGAASALVARLDELAALGLVDRR